MSTDRNNCAIRYQPQRSIPPERNQVHPTHIRDTETIQRIEILHHNYYHWCLGCCPKDTQTQPRKATPIKGENRYHNPEDTESCPNWNFKNMQDCHENVERDFMTVDVGQWTLKTLPYCLRPVYTMISTLDIYIYIYIYYIYMNFQERVLSVNQSKRFT